MSMRCPTKMDVYMTWKGHVLGAKITTNVNEIEMSHQDGNLHDLERLSIRC